MRHEGQKELLRAVRRLLDEGHPCNVLLHRLAPQPPRGEDLDGIARDHAAPARIDTGPTSDPEPRDRAASSDFGVVPSTVGTDTFLAAMGEAMACGAVPAATAQRGMRHSRHSFDLDAPGATGPAVPRPFRVADPLLTDAVRDGAVRMLNLWHDAPERLAGPRQRAVVVGRGLAWKAKRGRFLAVSAACGAGTRPADATPAVHGAVGTRLPGTGAPSGVGHGPPHGEDGGSMSVRWNDPDARRAEAVPAAPSGVPTVPPTPSGGWFTGTVPHVADGPLAVLVTDHRDRTTWAELALGEPMSPA
ncbi:hypothetical protein [Streptomyces sp. NPDC086519]|uniref:hypothetical protein n=1 Tax=Streptomyces sp. NPDC086519 TaxID=3154863 RepID=UPI00343C5D27